MHLILLIIFGLLGGILGHRLNIPAGGMIGAILAVMIYKQSTQTIIVLPAKFEILAQILIGISIGAGFTHDFFIRLKSVFFPAIFTILLLLLFCVFLAIILKKITGLDIVTSLLATTPGGLTEMSSFSLVFKAETVVVLTIHLFRILAISVLIPVAVYISGYWGGK